MGKCGLAITELEIPEALSTLEDHTQAQMWQIMSWLMWNESDWVMILTEWLAPLV